MCLPERIAYSSCERYGAARMPRDSHDGRGARFDVRRGRASRAVKLRDVFEHGVQADSNDLCFTCSAIIAFNLRFHCVKMPRRFVDLFCLHQLPPFFPLLSSPILHPLFHYSSAFLSENLIMAFIVEGRSASFASVSPCCNAASNTTPTPPTSHSPNVGVSSL